MASNNGNLYMKEILRRFSDYYSEHYLELMQSSVDNEKLSNWLRLFVRNNNGMNRSPLRHLLFMQFLRIDSSTLFNDDLAVGRKPNTKIHQPIFNINKRREKWLTIVEDNPGATRSELKEIGKGLHTWIFRHDLEWYEKVTPRNKPRKRSVDTIDWEQRDRECLSLAEQAVQSILQREGKPTRVTPLNIKNTLGLGSMFNNKKLIHTNQFIQEIKEDIEAFRVRKIKWTIDEMISKGEVLTPYKIQLYAGFGGGNKEVRRLILKSMEKYI